MTDLRLAFRNFLERAQDESWIVSYDWQTTDSFKSIREKFSKYSGETFSKTHKRAPDGKWWGVSVEAYEDTFIGIDLEYLSERPILKSPEWLAQRLNMGRTSTSKQVLEEWSCRESAFKSLVNLNQNLVLSQFRKSGASGYNVPTPEGEKIIQTRLMWRDNWLLSLAWRSR